MHYLENLTKKQKIILGIVAGLLLIAGIAYFSRDAWVPVPDNTTYRSGSLSFTYPRTESLKEYGSSAIYLGSETDTEFASHIEVVQYRSDPDAPLPASFDAFAKKQAQFLCGTDGAVESVTCTNPVSEPITTAGGLVGQKLSLLFTRKDLTSGAVSTSTYTPVYVFNTTEAADEGEALRYRALFVYPSVSGFLAGTTTPVVLQQVIDTLTITDGVSTVGQPAP